MTEWTAESLPAELVAILDEQAGKTHSPTRAVRRCLPAKKPCPDCQAVARDEAPQTLQSESIEP